MDRPWDATSYAINLHRKYIQNVFTATFQEFHQDRRCMTTALYWLCLRGLWDCGSLWKSCLERKNKIKRCGLAALIFSQTATQKVIWHLRLVSFLFLHRFPAPALPKDMGTVALSSQDWGLTLGLLTWSRATKFIMSVQVDLAGQQSLWCQYSYSRPCCPINSSVLYVGRQGGEASTVKYDHSHLGSLNVCMRLNESIGLFYVYVYPRVGLLAYEW